jgi:hypothetical protein
MMASTALIFLQQISKVTSIGNIDTTIDPALVSLSRVRDPRQPKNEI